MSQSASIPQFTVEIDIDIGPLDAIRTALAADGLKVSLTDVFVAAVAWALREHPTLNASFSADAIILQHEINVALAIALDDGLIAPAIRHADSMKLTELAAARVRLTEAARAGNLTAEDVTSSTFTISNLGSFGVRRFNALVVPPQAAILAVGALTPENLISLSLSCDHRIVDGAPAALFLKDLAKRIESPDWVQHSV